MKGVQVKTRWNWCFLKKKKPPPLILRVFRPKKPGKWYFFNPHLSDFGSEGQPWAPSSAVICSPFKMDTLHWSPLWGCSLCSPSSHSSLQLADRWMWRSLDLLGQGAASFTHLAHVGLHLIIPTLSFVILDRFLHHLALEWVIEMPGFLIWGP